jgi:hypothetical protein
MTVPVLRRPRLLDGPAEVLSATADLLEGRVVSETPATAGFTPAVASLVRTADGRPFFVKAAPPDHGLADAIRAGVEVAPVIGDLGPALLGFGETAGWAIAVYTAVDGAALEWWHPSAVEQMVDVLAVLRSRLSTPRFPHSTPYAEAFAPLLGTWAALAAPPDASTDTTVKVEHLRGRPLPAPIPISELAELEAQWLPSLRAGTALQHGDLRRDNVIQQLSSTGRDDRLWVVDWTHLWTGPGWLDLIRLGPDLAACGHDPDSILRRSCWADAPPDEVNVALAGLASRAWRDGYLPDVPELPGLRAMQREHGRHLLRWLAVRLGHVA